eukprot:11517646-Karenia_brevis.AAC.1
MPLPPLAIPPQDARWYEALAGKSKWVGGHPHCVNNSLKWIGLHATHVDMRLTAEACEAAAGNSMKLI